MTKSLYERLGGEAAIRAVVSKMYEKILDDSLLAPFFDHVDVETLRHSQIAFVSYAFGGRPSYLGRNLQHVHAKSVSHGLTDIHFDRVAEHLSNTMQELGVTDALISEAIAVVETTRVHVLGRATA